jgi:hypothetical protein
MSHTTIQFGAFASIQYIAPRESFLGTNQGDLEGAIWARITSKPQEIGNGQSTFTMFHEFLCTDGSTLSTTDTALTTKVHGSDEATLTVQHTVVSSTGRFEGKRGTFPSFGVHNFKTGQGVQRFSGTLA